MKRLLSVFSMMVVMTITAPVFAVEKADVATLKNYVQSLQTLRANFIQVQPEEAIYQQNKSVGYLVLKRPGKLMWVYQTPEQQEIISDGRNLWIFESEIDQASVRPLASVQDDFPMRWLLYNEDLEKHFEIIPGQKENGLSWFNLVPREGTFFQSLDIAIANNQMVQVWMYQSEDNITKVEFTDIEQNNTIANNQFDFNPPKGVDVIGQPLP